MATGDQAEDSALYAFMRIHIKQNSDQKFYWVEWSPDECKLVGEFQDARVLLKCIPGKIPSLSVDWARCGTFGREGLNLKPWTASWKTLPKLSSSALHGASENVCGFEVVDWNSQFEIHNIWPQSRRILEERPKKWRISDGKFKWEMKPQMIGGFDFLINTAIKPSPFAEKRWNRWILERVFEIQSLNLL